MPGDGLTVVQLLPALNAGGVERSALEIGRALVAAGHRSIVISAGGRLASMLTEQGSEHITLDVGRKSLATLRQIWRLRRLFAELKPDVVHARSRLPAWLTRFAIRGLRPRPHFVTTVHGLNSPSLYSSILTRGERVICVSNSVRDYVLKHYPDTDPARLTVIPRGVDPREFPFGYKPDDAWRAGFLIDFPKLAQGGALLTLPGRGTRLKGHADAIELLAGLRSRSLDCTLLLLGVREPGREAYVAELEQLAATRGVADRVIFSVPRNDVREIFSISALVLQLSIQPEAFGRTVLEAIALCRPVVGYAHGGVGELLAELYPEGRVAPGDITRLIERAAELLRVAPPIAPLQRYRLADMQSATLQVYTSLAARANAAQA